MKIIIITINIYMIYRNICTYTVRQKKNERQTGFNGCE